MCCSRQTGLKISYPFFRRNSWKTGCTMNLQGQLVSMLHFPQAGAQSRASGLCSLVVACHESLPTRAVSYRPQADHSSENILEHTVVCFCHGIGKCSLKFVIEQPLSQCVFLCFIFQGLHATSGRLASISFSKIREVKAKLAKLLALLISSLSLISLTRFVRSQMLQPGAYLLTKHFLKTRAVLQSRQTLSTSGLLCTVQVLNFTFLDVPSLLDLKSLLPVESKLHVRDSSTAS